MHVPESTIGANLMDITLIMPLCALSSRRLFADASSAG